MWDGVKCVILPQRDGRFLKMINWINLQFRFACSMLLMIAIAMSINSKIDMKLIYFLNPLENLELDNNNEQEGCWQIYINT